MEGIYLDNGATTFPKAPGVVESIGNYLTNIGCNINRGAYNSSFQAENLIYDTRELLCELFNFHKAENVVFTKSITESLNVLIKGLCKKGDHVIVSSMEHNAVMRPINSLKNMGVEYSRVKCSQVGDLNPSDLLKHIKKNTKAVIMLQASNVCGTILDLESVGKICKEKGIYFIIDTAQTAGFLNVDYEKLNADVIAFTGHKGLLGPQGIGGFAISDTLAKEIDSFIDGGTGSLSEHELQPQYMPDKFEAGTLNIPGIFGLNASLKYLLKEGISSIRQKELYLLEEFLNKVSNINSIRIVGKNGIEDRTSLVSLDFTNHDNGEISYRLYKEFGIMTRCGLHCAPSAHKTLNTFPHGTVRFSFSHFNTIHEVNYTIESINKCIK
ncbi:MAG: aminotransferase class V-fold PLP-dependent enzyme [Anaeromicrobium sp.]|jgi:cysteine desulfurase family protein|uniref:aminotransferase class V-fold PLP-dependent enzyme n=1 Tax=Anaeromicrobium sp. TaxID=1929132 RepID=UPI0025EBB14A|nr:aminotransferase class V-fold PLP-dependent enzyme [Anaeromicrobium sp.]MCT4594263.1 aminotransferase class V-fold PLP-dependent enzyme [Anaeromicrobium sp.]